MVITILKVPNQKKAFTLVEMILAMGIIAFLIGMGSVALIRFRSVAKVERVHSDLISTLRTTQNSAENSKASFAKKDLFNLTISESLPDYYMVYFENNNYSIYFCDKSGSGANCFPETQNLKSANLSGVDITVTGCQGVAFERLTGNIVSIDSTGAVSETGSCTIRIKATSLSSTRTIEVDFISNNIKI